MLTFIVYAILGALLFFIIYGLGRLFLHFMYGAPLRESSIDYTFLNSVPDDELWHAILTLSGRNKRRPTHQELYDYLSCDS